MVFRWNGVKVQALCGGILGPFDNTKLTHGELPGTVNVACVLMKTNSAGHMWWCLAWRGVCALGRRNIPPLAFSPYSRSKTTKGCLATNIILIIIWWWQDMKCFLAPFFLTKQLGENTCYTLCGSTLQSPTTLRCRNHRVLIFQAMQWVCCFHLGSFTLLPCGETHKRPTPASTEKYSSRWGWTDTPTDIPPEGGASCVQNFDDSLDFAIRMTYRISLRSSSLWEPRHPLLNVFFILLFFELIILSKKYKTTLIKFKTICIFI